MEKINNICGKIELNSQRVIDNLNQESIEVYNFIQNEYKKGNITKNFIFQFAFRSFYKLDSAGLTSDFKTRYFELFEKNIKSKNPDLVATLTELSSITNFKNQKTIQFSFVTKMFHTINNNEPIYDNEVITVFGFKQPYYIKETHKRIDVYLKQYQEIRDTYDLIKQENLLKNSINKFHDRFSKHQVNDTMIIDFIFWSAGKLIREEMLK